MTKRKLSNLVNVKAKKKLKVSKNSTKLKKGKNLKKLTVRKTLRQQKLVESDNESDEGLPSTDDCNATSEDSTGEDIVTKHEPVMESDDDDDDEDGDDSSNDKNVTKTDNLMMGSNDNDDSNDDDDDDEEDDVDAGNGKDKFSSGVPVMDSDDEDDDEDDDDDDGDEEGDVDVGDGKDEFSSGAPMMDSDDDNDDDGEEDEEEEDHSANDDDVVNDNNKDVTKGSHKIKHDKDSNQNDDDGDDTVNVKKVEKNEKKRDMEGVTVADNKKMKKSAPSDTSHDTSQKQFYKPPTNEELNRLRETENLFHSTLFRLQITEILNEVKVKAKRFKVIDKAVDIVRNILLSVEPTERYEIQDDSWLNESKMKLPIHKYTQPMKGSFKFFRPQEVSVTGSYPLGTCIRQNMSVDITLKIPKGCFHPKDYINHCYLQKRALYLCKVAMVLNSNQSIEDVRFTYHHGNHLKPLVVCNVKVEDKKSVTVHLHAVPETGVFSVDKFHVSKNNVRTSWYQQDSSLEVPPENDVPTPFYNSTLLEDVLAAEDKLVQRLESCSNGVREGILLLKIWLRQRELDVGFGGFSGYMMTLYVLYLLSKRKLNQQMSSYQIMRNTLLKLSEADWMVDGITLCSNEGDSNMPLLSEFHKHFDVVFVDYSGYLNVCYEMNTSTFNRVKHEASLAMKILEDKSIDSFDRLFMKRVPFCHKFDHVFHVCNKDSFESCVDKFGLRPVRYLDYWSNAAYVCLPSILQALGSGLGRRVTLIQCQQIHHQAWKVTKKPPDQVDKLTFGLLLDSEFAFNVLDRGPSADRPEAAEFRKFWGEKSELRRFQDGGICEAVLWTSSKKSSVRQMVCKQIVKYVLEQHCGIKSSPELQTVQYFGDQLNSVLTSLVTNEANATNVMRVYDDLAKILRKLDDLPLNIVSIQGVSPCFRYTEVFPPVPCTFKVKDKKVTTNNLQRFIPNKSSICPVYTQALKVICTMETSGKWPDDLEAMKRLKAAFLIQMGQLIKSQYNLPVKISTTHLDILKDSYVFRVVLAYTKEIDLYRTIRTGDGLVRKRDTPQALALEREIINLPKLTSTLHGIQQLHNTFSTTVRLAKRWICSHMLGDYILDEAIELIVVYLYLTPAPYTPPTCGFAGFQRFLELLSTYDWKMNPLIVNLNNEFTEEDLQEISTQFTERRGELPLMFIATPQNKLSSHWTASTPTPPILNRLVQLAQSSLDLMHQQIDTERSVSMKQLFRPPLDLYDVLFELNMDFVAQPYHQLDLSSHVRESLIPIQSTSHSSTQDCFPVIDFNPIKMLIREIRESFDDVCMVFYDEFGGSVIGLVWKPEVFKSKEFKISNINRSKLKLEDNNKPSLVQNIDAIIYDITVMGGELIKDIRYKQ